MTTRTNHQLTLPTTGQGVIPIAIPVGSLQLHGNSKDLDKVEQNTTLHLAAMHAHATKAELFIEIATDIATKSADAFLDYARSSEARMNEARGMKLENDIELVEHHFRQSLFGGLSSNAHDNARKELGLVVEPVLPRPEPEPKRGFLARVLNL